MNPTDLPTKRTADASVTLVHIKQRRSSSAFQEDLDLDNPAVPLAC